MVTSALTESNDTEDARLNKLLELIHVPAERTGLSYALPNLLASAQAISKIAPQHQALSNLVSLLTKANQTIGQLNRHPMKAGMNPMLRRYGEYPVYSLFTQQEIYGEKEQNTKDFQVLTGLLLAEIWLSEVSWDVVPTGGYFEFVNNLRKIRKNQTWEELPSNISSAESLEQLIKSINTTNKNIIAVKARVLAVNVLNKLSVESHLPTTEFTTKTSSPENYDLGDDDVWQVGKEVRNRSVVTGRPPALSAKKIILREQSVHQVGVDSAEDEVTSKIAEVPPTQNLGVLPDLSQQKGLVLEARYADEFDNQFLPYKWENLNEFEVNNLIRKMKLALSNLTAATNVRIGALISGLSIVTSRSPETLGEFRFFKSKPSTQPVLPFVILDQGCWFSPFPPLKRFSPTAEQSEWLRPIGEGCFLPLPAELLSVLSELCVDGETLDKALGCSPEKLDKLAKDFCKTVRQDARSRANVAWLRTVMFQRMYALSKDEIGTVATLGNTELAPSVGLFYATFDQNHWREIYEDAITTLELTPFEVGSIESLPYGSRQFPQENKLRAWITAFGESASSQCKQARSLSDIRAGHNKFACYSFLMMVAATSHRPSALYTFNPSAFDLENKWAIISDKITSPSTRVRLTPLPDILIEQIKNYESHLHNLSPRLYSEYPELSTKVSMLVDEPRHVLIPYLFWLNEDFSTVPIDIDLIKKQFMWPYDGKAFKHFMATGLRKEGVPAEYITILLAHVEAGQYGFGKFSALSPPLWQKLITPSLDRLLESQGWESIEGLTHLRKSLPDHRVMKNKLFKQPEYEFFAKAKAHVNDSKLDREAVRSAFLVAKKNTPSDAPRDDFLAAFREEIAKCSQEVPDRLAKRLNFHVRFVRLHRRALAPTSIPGWNADMNVEDTPMQPETLRLAEYARDFREAVPKFSESFSTLKHHERIQLIMVSAILFGGLLRRSLVEQLHERLAGGVCRLGGYLWIDFDDPQSGGCQRWFPDPATSLLIGRFLAIQQSDQSAQYNKVRFGIPLMLNKICKFNPKLVEIRSIDDLIRISRAFFALHLPGSIRAFACGEVRSASLMESAWVRLLTGRPVVAESSRIIYERGSIRPHRHSSQNEKISNEILSKIRNVIRDEFPASSSGATNRKGMRRNRLASLSKKLAELDEQYENMPSVLTAIIRWTDHLATEGSVVVRNPETTTIYSYVTDISKALIMYGAEVDFIQLSDAELIDIYQRVIDHGSKNTRSARAQSLRWFHEFGEEEFDFPDIDWGEVAPGLTKDKSNVSANMVTFQEYSIAKEIIRNHPMLNKRDRQMHEVALIIIYRCGLRLGELLRLTVSDFIFHTKSVLLIRNGIYGKTKTRAGVRQIPWLQNLDKAEVTLLKEWISHRKSMIKEDPWGAIFGTEEEGRLLEMRLYLSRIITAVLRAVTGDPAIKIHHLRHGAATSALTLALTPNRESSLTKNASEWFGSNAEDIASEFRVLHLGQPMLTRRIEFSIAQTLGHTSPRTSLWHYGHSLDVILYEYVTKLTSLKNIQVAQLSGMTQNQLNVAAFRNPDKAPAAIALDWILRDMPGLNPKTHIANEPICSIQNLPLPPTIRWITSPKLAHSILTDLSNGFHVVQLANRYAREEIEIDSLEATAKLIERKTGYRKFRLIKSPSDGKEKYMSSDQQKILAGLISGYAISLGAEIKQALEKNAHRKSLNDGVEVWVENYQESSSGLRLPLSDDINKIIELLQIIDVKKSQIILASNSLERVFDYLSTAKIELPSENIIKRSDSFRSARRMQLGLIDTATLLLEIGKSKTKKSDSRFKGGQTLAMQKFHHLLFLTSVLHQCRRPDLYEMFQD